MSGEMRKAKPRQKHDLKSQLKQVAAATISSTATRFVIQPFEVLKIRFQLQVEPVSRRKSQNSKYKSFFQACRLISHEEGIKSFWKGHNAGQVMSLVYGISQFWSYEQIYMEFKQMPVFMERKNYNRFLSGALSGSFATLISMPFDVVRTRLVVQDKGSGYRSATKAIPIIIQQEGVRGLYRGLGTSIVQMFPLIGANFLFYGIFNDIAGKFLRVEENQLLPTWVLLVTGSSSGAISKIAVYPLDFLKRRLQVQGFHDHRKTFGKNLFCSGMISCMMVTLREEGALGFYKGMGPTLIKSAVSAAVYFSVYDKMKYVM